MTTDVVRRNGVQASLTLAVMAVSVGVATWCVTQGLMSRQAAPKQLAGQLLDVKTRSELPFDFELETLDGQKVKLKDLQNKTVFLNFWATWCPPCIEEMPSLRRLYAKLAGHPDFVFLAVSTDESWGVVRRFFEREPANFTVLLDPKGQVAAKYGTSKFPETYIIDRGELVGHIIGPRDWDRWFAEAWLQEILEG